MKAIISLLILSGLAVMPAFSMETNDNQAVTDTSKTITYLALGDSYTIGEKVEQKESYPYQLAAQLKLKNVNVAEPKVIATTGWTTSELANGIAQADIKQKFDLVTLLIGVNNQYRGLSRTEYRQEFVKLLNTAIDFAGGNKKHVIVISIPDWSVTPFAEGRDRQLISDQIDLFNAINLEESERAGVKYVDITGISKDAKTDAELNASDGLHPSGKMYSLWVKKLLPVVIKSLK